MSLRAKTFSHDLSTIATASRIDFQLASPAFVASAAADARAPRRESSAHSSGARSSQPGSAHLLSSAVPLPRALPGETHDDDGELPSWGAHLCHALILLEAEQRSRPDDHEARKDFDEIRALLLPLLPELDPYVAGFVADHGVSKPVALLRRYVRWTTDNVEVVREAYKSLRPGQLRMQVRQARQSDGVLFDHHAPPGFPPILAQMRSDNPVQTDPRPRWEYHPDVLPDEPPVYPADAGALAGKPFPEWKIRNPKGLEPLRVSCRLFGLSLGGFA
jgi:hypothetical protein